MNAGQAEVRDGEFEVVLGTRTRTGLEYLTTKH